MIMLYFCTAFSAIMHKLVYKLDQLHIYYNIIGPYLSIV